MDWLKQYNIYLQGLILSSIIFFALFIILVFLHFSNIKLSRKRLKYLYAFSSGFLLITAIVGQLVTSRSKFMKYWVHHNMKIHPNSDGDPTFSQTIIMLLIIILGLFIGSLIAYFVKKKSLKNQNKHDHDLFFKDHQKHSHAFDTPVEIIHENKNHNSIVSMILTHKLPAGLIIGILLVNFNNGGEFAFAALLSFILHIIPELIIIYYARIENKYSRKNSFIFSVIVKLFIIPFIFLGIIISNYINIEGNWTFWIMPFLLSITSIVMVWGSIFELGPVFIHTTEDKETFKLIFTFIIGISLSMAIQLIHVH